MTGFRHAFARSEFGPKSKLAAAAAALSLVAAHSQAGVHTYTNVTDGTTTQWSATPPGSGWDTTPVSDPATQLFFGAGATLAAGANIISNNDLAGDFVLNRIDFTYAGPASGTAPTVTVKGNPLSFTGASAGIYYNTTGTGVSSRPRLIIENDIKLSSNLTVRTAIEGGKPDITLKGAITGNFGVTFTTPGGVNGTLALSNSGNAYTGNTTMAVSTTTGRSIILRLDADEVIPDGAGKGNFVFSTTSEQGNHILQLNGNDETVNGLVSNIPGTTGTAASHTIRNGSTGAATLTVGAANTAGSFVGTIENGAGTGFQPLSLTKTGTETQVLSGVATHSGATKIDGGKLKIDYSIFGTGVTATPTNYFSAASDMTLAGGTTFEIQGRGDGAAIHQENVALGSGGAGRNFTLPNAVASQLVVGQELVFTKTDLGANTLVAGTNYIAAIEAPGTTTTVVRAQRRMTSGSLTATLDTSATNGTTSQTLKSLTLSGAAGQNATLDFGTTADVTLTVSAAPVQTNNGSTLTIANWDGTAGSNSGPNHLIFAGEPTDFSGVFTQAEVIFTDYGIGYQLIDLGATYEVVAAVPEPGSLALLALGGMSLLARRRRA